MGSEGVPKTTRLLRSFFCNRHRSNLNFCDEFNVCSGYYIWNGQLILFIILVRQHLLLRDANIIWDNPILTVSSSIITKSEGKKWESEETIVSTFGILMGSKIYKWGSEGVHGVRLKSVLIDRERFHLTFGDPKKTICVEMLHGMADERTVLDVQKRLLYETGVSVMISGW